MTDTRMVRLEQIAAGKFEPSEMYVDHIEWLLKEGFVPYGALVICKQIGDATGGDVFEPISGLEAGLAEALRRAKWPHLVQVEVVNG